MRAILLFIIMLITLQVNAQTLGYHRYDGTYVKPDYRPYSDGYTYDNRYSNEISAIKKRNISEKYSIVQREISTEQYITRSLYTQPSRTYNSSYSYYPVYSDISTLRSGDYSDSKYSTSNNYPSYSNNSKLKNIVHSNSKNSPYYVAVRSLNIRSGPSTGHKLLGDLNYGESVNIVESYANGWKKIHYTHYDAKSYSFITKYGYVSGSYLSSSKPNKNYNYSRNKNKK